MDPLRIHIHSKIAEILVQPLQFQRFLLLICHLVRSNCRLRPKRFRFLLGEEEHLVSDSLGPAFTLLLFQILLHVLLPTTRDLMDFEVLRIDEFPLDSRETGALVVLVIQFDDKFEEASDELVLVVAGERLINAVLPEFMLYLLLELSLLGLHSLRH